MKLRETRLQRGLDLAEVAAATKIQTRFLVAIENEEWDLLPGEFYARSFIRSYADHLGLDDIGAAELSEASMPAPAERLPRIEPEPPEEAHYVHRKRLSPRLLVALATLGLGAVALAVALSSQGGDSSGPPQKLTENHVGGQKQQVVRSPAEPAARPPGASLTLTATGEVWVCLLDGRGQALIDGQILDPGSEQGPYRSDGFTVSLGNGAVTMSVGGQTASIPPTPNPIGFAIGREGGLRQLPEGERPTCT